MNFNLDDFRRQLQRMREAGSILDLPRHAPGSIPGDAPIEDGEAVLGRVMTILDCMTSEERLDPGIIDAPRRLRIARDAEVAPEDVSTLLHQYEALAAVVCRLTGAGRAPVALLERRALDLRRVPVASRRLQAHRELTLAERRELRHRWDLFGRRGLPLPGLDPWFSQWNKNLRLWELPADS